MKAFVDFVSDVFDQFGIYKVALILLSIIFFIFDVWQLFNSANVPIAIVACLCLIVSAAGGAEIIRLEAQYYGLVILAPLFLLLLSVVAPENFEWLASDFYVSALATAMSAVVPTIGAAAITAVIWLWRACTGQAK